MYILEINISHVSESSALSPSKSVECCTRKLLPAAGGDILHSGIQLVGTEGGTDTVVLPVGLYCYEPCSLIVPTIIMRESLQDRTVSSSWLVAEKADVLVSIRDTKRMMRITRTHIPAQDAHTLISNGVKSTAPYAPDTGGCRNKARLLNMSTVGYINLYQLPHLESRLRVTHLALS
jgi:hypothetical protein